SGADAYDSGEYLYQDFIYDSYGANTTNAPLPPEPVPAATDTTFSGLTGDVVYPTDAETYAFDAADLLEFRARLEDGKVLYRVTLNTMLARDVAGVAIGIDTDADSATGASEWGYGIGSLGELGLEHVLISWGTAALLDGKPNPSTVDVRRNQITIETPLAPGNETWRHYLVVGLFDAATKTFKAVGDQPTETHPGGAHGTDAPPIFNVGFRFEEPFAGIDPTSGSRGAGVGNHREHGQALALAARDISELHADISFDKLRSRASESHAPASGHINRLYVSHLDLGEGAQPERPMFRGKIQPYSVFVPASYREGAPAPLHLWLHSLAAGYNQYRIFAPNSLTQLGDQRGSFILTPAGRGPDGWYHHEAEVDVFEAWADLKARYDIDGTRVTIGGYSMGGYGTYKLASQYPDLFAKAFAVVGPPDEDILGGPSGGAAGGDGHVFDIVENLRNVPLLMWNGMIDELVPVLGPIRLENRLHELGYRHELNVFPMYDHFLISIVDHWEPGRNFLGLSTIDPAPSHVTYRRVVAQDAPKLGLVHDHAYWVSGVTVAEGAEAGVVDARALVRGEAVPTPVTIAGVGFAPAFHIKRGINWIKGTEAPRNVLEVKLDGVSSVTIWSEQAGFDASKPFELRVDSAVPAVVTLAGRFGARALSAGAGTTTMTVAAAPATVAGTKQQPSASKPVRGAPSGSLPATGVPARTTAAAMLLAGASLALAYRRSGRTS
ncbi:MAG TPA: prolyl oligopeptidase family serine peptidase, partial [Actinomycetota bacterium]|nr:prolyl oligopeptidase family serine peptidase [Actinomycetota bacterium]